MYLHYKKATLSRAYLSRVVRVDQLVVADLRSFTADIFCTRGLLIQVAFALAGAD